MEIEIHGKKIGDGHPVFFIAEAGVNHNGSMELALKLIDVAAEAGADAVKFQTFRTEKMSTRMAPKSSYHIETTGPDSRQSWFDLLKTQELDRGMHVRLIDYCVKKDIIFLSTPYDEESANLLDELGAPAFKLASTDANNIPFIRYIAKKKKPMIVSTAMCEMEEVRQLVDAIRLEGLEDFVLLQCTGNYPLALEDSNLRVINIYRDIFQCLVGYSDHTPESINPVAATALGACVYEKHFTIDKSLAGPDHRMSLSPKELKGTILDIRKTERALGSKEKHVLRTEVENRKKLRKSLVASRSIKRGTRLMLDMVAVKRPGTGIPPNNLSVFLGKTLLVDVEEDSVLLETMFG